MKKTICLLLFALSASLAGYSQLLPGLSMNIFGGFDVRIQVDDNMVAVVSTGGDIIGFDARGWTEIHPIDMAHDEELLGKPYEINGIPIDYFDTFNTPDSLTLAKVRRIGDVFFDYYGPGTAITIETVGKMRRAGYLMFDYYDPSNTMNSEKWGKLRHVEGIDFDYFTREDTDEAEKWGLLKSINNYKFDYKITEPRSGNVKNITFKGKKRVVIGNTEIRIVQ